MTPAPTLPTSPAPVECSLCAEGLPETGMWKCDPTFADINGDGLVDIAAIARLGDGPHVWLGDGAGAWRDSSSGLATEVRSCGGGLSFGDVNNDGHLDLAVADHCRGVFVYLGDGGGSWHVVTKELYPTDLAGQGSASEGYLGAEDLDLADVNGDGNLDLAAISNDAGGLSVYLGDGTGANWTRHCPGLPTTQASNRIQFSDMNGDGFQDIVAAYCEGPRVWLGDGEGGWSEASSGLPSPIMKCLHRGTSIGDLNEDGRLDIATANWVDGPEVYLQQPDGSWQQTPDVFPAMLGGAVGLALGDIDKDGHLDMVVSGRLTQEVGYVYSVFLLLGNGRGKWEFVENSNLPATGLAFTWGIALADINDDGTLDIAAGSGGIVGTRLGPTEPSIASRLLVWCTRVVGGDDRAD